MGFSRLAMGIVTLVLLLAAAPLSAQEQASPLDGKILVVYLKSDPKAGAVLERVRVQNLGDRYFLVGSWVDMGAQSRAGLVQWIPIDDIGRIHEFNSIAELQDRSQPGS